MIKFFADEYYFLSNYYDPCRVTYHGITYWNSEAAYQAQKCKNPDERIRFAKLAPDVAKALGKSVEIREDWDDIRDEVMHDVVLAKFTQHPELAKKLIATRRQYLVEGNDWHDNHFGDCHCYRCRRIKGENVLGKILMDVREYLKKL